MAAYVDDAVWPWRGQLWCHLLADELDELHEFALRIGLRKAWFQAPPKASRPHYRIAPQCSIHSGLEAKASQRQSRPAWVVVKRRTRSTCVMRVN